MALSSPRWDPVSPAAYLASDRAAAYKSEYEDGAVLAMSGGSTRHSAIKTELTRVLGNQLQGTPCAPFDSDLRVRVDPSRYTYPDLSVVCGEAQVEDEAADSLLNPIAIFEVLSPTTEAYDRGAKWARYRRMPSLKQYVLVSQDRPLVEVFTRQGDVWVFAYAAGLEASMALPAIGCTLVLAELYARVPFGAALPEPSGGLGPPPQ